MENKMNNKGFSLVELIVVIAIMAVLMGVLAPTLIGNIEKSRESTDLQNLDTIKGAVVTALTDESAYNEVQTAMGANASIDISLGSPKTAKAGNISLGTTDEFFKKSMEKTLAGNIEMKSTNAVNAKDVIITITKDNVVSVKVVDNSGAVVSCKKTLDANNAPRTLEAK